MKKDRHYLICPHCGSALVVDAETGDLITHTPPEEKTSTSFEERLNALDEEKNRSDEIFSQQMKAVKDRKRILEEKFKEAVEKSKETGDERPIRDIDLD